MRAQRRPRGGQGSEKPSAGRRGRTIHEDGLSSFGRALHPFIKTKKLRYSEIARTLGLKRGGNQVIGRMMRGDAHIFPFPLDALLRALEIPDAKASAIHTLASELKLQFAAHDAPAEAPSAPVAPGPGAPSDYGLVGVTHGWGFVESPIEVERDVIQLLWMGAADYAGRRAREKYYQLLYSERSRRDTLPHEMKKQWLLRFGAIIEQAEEMAGAWHADRVAASFQALRRMEADIAQIDGMGLSRSGFGYDQAIILARKAALLRERYVDDRPLSRFYLDMSVTAYEQALGELEIVAEARSDEFERRTLYPALTLALRFQRLHNDAVRGDPGWIDASAALADERTPFKQANSDLYEAISVYFKAMGYKRLAWALRPRDGQRDIFSGMRAAYYGEADRYITTFLASPIRDAAWQAANLRPFALPDGRKSSVAQPSLVSPEQSSLLLIMSGLETAVWLRPDDVERETERLHGDAQRLYRALLAKLGNTRAFARALQGVAPQD